MCPSSQIVFSRVAREPLEGDEGHIVMFLTWLLESLSGCEIAHTVARAGTLVPISENETRLTFSETGIFATLTLRNCSGPASEAHTPAWRGPAFGGAPQSSQTAFAGRVAPPRARRRLRGQPPASQGRLRAWEGPRRSGGLRVSLRSLPGRLPGLRCSSRRALRRSRFRCPLGFPLSLSPLLYLHSINRHPPCQAPAVCPSPHFQPPYGTVGY